MTSFATPPVRQASDGRPMQSAGVLSASALGSDTHHEHGPAGYTVPGHRVREFARLAARHGWGARQVLSAAGIAPASLNQPCPGVTLEKSAEVLRHLWAVTSDKFLGLGPHPVSPDTLRVLAFATSGAPTLGSALARLQEFAPVFPGMPVPTVTSAADHTTVSFDLDGFDEAVSLIADSVLTIAHRLINWGTRQRIGLLRVEVPYSRPRGETDHDVVFGAPVRFGASRAALTFSTSFLAAPLVRRQEEVEQFLADVPAVLLSEFDFGATYEQRVRGILERCLGDRICNADEIAAGLGISRQTLRRRLHEEHTSVTAIRDAVLRGAAIESLSHGGESVSALACRLGFSEPSAFTRAFRRWTGQSPSAFVRTHSTVSRSSTVLEEVR